MADRLALMRRRTIPTLMCTLSDCGVLGLAALLTLAAGATTSDTQGWRLAVAVMDALLALGAMLVIGVNSDRF